MLKVNKDQCRLSLDKQPIVEPVIFFLCQPKLFINKFDQLTFEMKTILEPLPQASPDRIIFSTKLKMAALSNVANTMAIILGQSKAEADTLFSWQLNFHLSTDESQKVQCQIFFLMLKLGFVDKPSIHPSI